MISIGVATEGSGSDSAVVSAGEGSGPLPGFGLQELLSTITNFNTYLRRMNPMSAYTSLHIFDYVLVALLACDARNLNVSRMLHPLGGNPIACSHQAAG